MVTSTLQPPAPTLKQIAIGGTNVIILATNNTGLLVTKNLTAFINLAGGNSGTFDANGLMSVTNPIIGNGTNRLFFIVKWQGRE